MDPDGDEIWIAAGLLDQGDTGADDRRELLTWLTTRGVSIDQMRNANADGELAALAGDLALRSRSPNPDR